MATHKSLIDMQVALSQHANMKTKPTKKQLTMFLVFFAATFKTKQSNVSITN